VASAAAWSRTTEAQRVQAVFGPFDLQQQQEHLVVDLLALGADHDVHGPGHLRGRGLTGKHTGYTPRPSSLNELQYTTNNTSLNPAVTPGPDPSFTIY